jgi:Amt family ammonium transporter
MTLPGLALFYGGLVRRKNILSVVAQCFGCAGLVTIMWWAFGYSAVFASSGSASGSSILGSMKFAFLKGVTSAPNADYGPWVSHSVFAMYQMMFAIITPALITGAFVNRVNFKAYFIFLTVWQILVYYPFVHMIWGGGLLAQWGVQDFAGGVVVHATAGFAALASVFYVGARVDRNSTPNSIPLVAIGSGLLWFGWYGFNAGSEVAVDTVTSLAFLNTDVAASFATVAWLFLEWAHAKKPKFVGLLTGSIAGLATITPCAGFVPLWAAPIIGMTSSVLCYLAVQFKNKMKWDDALDVWGVHGVGGVLGTVLLGVFAAKSVNAGSADGLLLGNGSFFLKQTVAAIVGAAYAFVFTYIMLVIINFITPVKVNEEAEKTGLDYAIHGEKAYDEGAI